MLLCVCCTSYKLVAAELFLCVLCACVVLCGGSITSMYAGCTVGPIVC